MFNFAMNEYLNIVTSNNSTSGAEGEIFRDIVLQRHSSSHSCCLFLTFLILWPVALFVKLLRILPGVPSLSQNVFDALLSNTHLGSRLR